MDSSRIIRSATWLACAVSWAVAMPVAAQIQVDFVPSSLVLNAGERALVEVQVTGVPAPGLAAFQFSLDFDPQAVDLLNPNEAFRGTISPFAPLGGNPLCTTVRQVGTCTDPNWFLTSSGRVPLGVDSIDNINGRIEVGYATSGAPAPPTGAGTIALIEVFAAFNGTAVVTLSDVILADNQQPPMPFGVSLGSLTITSGTGIANQVPVLAAVGNRQLYEGQSIDIALSATDSDNDTLTFSTAGQPSFCILTDNGNGTGNLACAPALGESGTYPISVRATDDGGPNLVDSETFDLIVDMSSCVDVDADGFGLPGDVSCPLGTPTDCDDGDPQVNPAASEICRSGVDEDCNGLNGSGETFCSSPLCIEIALGSPGTDPTLNFRSTTACPSPTGLPRGIDLIWGNFANVVVGAGQIEVGPVSSVTCGGLLDIEQIDNLTPTPGELDFYLARESSQPAYGIGDGLPRFPLSGDCP